MLRGLLIVICSFAAVSAEAFVSHTGTGGSIAFQANQAFGIPGQFQMPAGAYGLDEVVPISPTNGVVFPQNTNFLVRYWRRTDFTGVYIQRDVQEHGAWRNFIGGSTTGYAINTQIYSVNGSVFSATGPWGTMTGADPLQTNSFSWTFGPEWAGTILQVRATNGTSLGTWGLPSVIGSNYVLSASIVTNQSLLSGAQVFLDGVPAAVLATAGTNSNLEAFADRPGYALSFGGDYQGGEWQIRRSDGSVAGTGSAATLGTVTSGRVTLLPEGSTGSIWTRVPAGDGMGAVWINSGISVSGNNVTTYNFAAAPAPTPLPTPAFQTNAPAPTITNAPAPTTPGTNTTAPAPVATNDVTVDVDELEAIPTDDGEEAALEGVRNASEKLRGILDDFRGSFENVALTFNEFRKFTLGGVGTVCTFQLGGVTINLSNVVPPWLRSGMKLAILMLAVFAMVRYTWETFS